MPNIKPKRITSDSLWLMITKLITASIGIVTSKIIAVKFTLEQAGTYSQLQLIYSTATAFLILGLTDATNYFYNSVADEKQKQKYLNTVFIIQLIVGTIGALAILLGRSFIVSYFDNAELYGLVPLAAFIPLFMNLGAMLQVLFVSNGKAIIIAIRNLIVSIMMLCAIVVACFFSKSVKTIVIIELILNFAQIVIFYSSITKYGFCFNIRDFVPEYCVTILKFSIPMALCIATSEVARSIDKYIIGFFTNTEELAIYSNAAKMLPFDVFTISMVTVITPVITKHIANKDFSEAQKIYKSYLRIGYLTTWIIVAAVIVNAKEVMLFLYDRKYLAGLPIFVIYMFDIMAKFASATFVLVAASKTKLLMICSVCAAALNAVFSIIAFKLMGTIGPAITTLVISIALSLTLVAFGARELKCSIFSCFNFKEITVHICKIIIVSAVTLAIKSIISKYIISNVLILIISFSAFLGLMILLTFNKIKDCMHELA